MKSLLVQINFSDKRKLTEKMLYIMLKDALKTTKDSSNTYIKYNVK